jgi:diaminopimelate dehydrogenase
MQRVTRLRLAIVGFGRLGQACAQAILKEESITLAGIVRRPERVGEPLPDYLRQVKVADHISGLENVDAALLCVPALHVLGVAHDLMQQRIPVVECASLHGEEFLSHKHELDRLAALFRVPAIVGAGWDPGALSLFRNLFALFCPHGHTEIAYRPGINMHHSSTVADLPGVKGAMATELRSAEGVRQNYFYIELEEGADFETIEQRLHEDPLFIGEELLIFPVDSIAELEERGHGVVMERHGSAGGAEHQLFLLEARFSDYALSAQVMLNAAQALPRLGKRAYSLFDLQPGVLWGEMREMAEKQWE